MPTACCQTAEVQKGSGKKKWRLRVETSKEKPTERGGVPCDRNKGFRPATTVIMASAAPTEKKGGFKNRQPGRYTKKKTAFSKRTASQEDLGG